MKTVFYIWGLLFVFGWSATGSASEALDSDRKALMDRAITAYIGRSIVREVALTNGNGESVRPVQFPVSMAKHYLDRYPLVGINFFSFEVRENEMAANFKYPNGVLMGGRISRLMRVNGKPGLILHANRQDPDVFSSFQVQFDEKWLEPLMELGRGDSIALICTDFAYDKPSEEADLSVSCEPASAHVMEIASIGRAKSLAESTMCEIQPWSLPDPSVYSPEQQKQLKKTMHYELGAPDAQVALLRSGIYYNHGSPEKAREALGWITSTPGSDYLFKGEIRDWRVHPPMSELLPDLDNQEKDKMMFEVIKEACNA